MFGALIVKEEIDEVIELVRGFISALENASTGSHHIGLRYSRLLKSLWFSESSRRTEGSTGDILDKDSIREPARQPQSTGGIYQPLFDHSTTGVPENINPMTADRNLLETSSFEPFYGDFSNIDLALFDLLPQSGLELDMLQDNSYPIASYNW